jgi:phosphoglycerol transferase MdoB-like AlkP superfamily enzyme
MIDNKSYWLTNHFKRTALKIGLVLLIYQIIRFLFFILNFSYFNHVGLSDYIRLVFHSIRFDLSIVFAINLPFVFFALLPFEFTSRKWYQRILNAWFILSNTICFIFDLADIGYYPYVRKRMTADVFNLLGKKSDFIDLMPAYFREFWYVFLFIGILTFLFFLLTKKINQRTPLNRTSSVFLKRSVVLILTIGISILFIRGGLQLKPIQLFNALLVADNADVPLIVNTPFSILHSFEQKKLKPLSFFSETDLKKQINPIKNYSSNQPMDKMNVVMIILESFGKGYTGIGGRTSYTPFLDSLMSEGLVFSNAFANAYRSSDGIPACIAGIPHFMDEPFVTSTYATNKIDALPSLLKQEGYSSSFFHGGTNGTMSFDVFASHAGFDQYYGRSEYGNDADYDGTWGIWDQPFLHYFGNQLDQEKQPFFSIIFTLSSHEPFALPKGYQNSTIQAMHSIQRGVAYTDESLRTFFKSIENKKWYNNTLFVITADHNFLACKDSLNYYNQHLGLFSIPVLFYKPNDKSLKGTNTELFQQIDIMPTILNYMHYPNSFFAYGKSGFDTSTNAMAFCMIDNYNYTRVEEYVFTGYGNSIDAVYDFKQDSTLQHKMLERDSIIEKRISTYKAFKQLLINTIIDNKQSRETYINTSN